MSGEPRVGVIGLGAMGSAAAFHLARRGARVVGFERFGPAHTQGSSHGESRIIRKAYYEDPCYVPLLIRAYELWAELESLSGESLFTRTGGLMLGLPDSEVVSGSLASAARWNLACRRLTAGEVHDLYPAFRPSPELVGVTEPDAGVLRPEAAVLCHLRAAAERGAELHFGERVAAW